MAVPTHFFKVIVAETEGGAALELEAYVLPNEAIPDNVPLATFQVYAKLISLDSPSFIMYIS